MLALLGRRLATSAHLAVAGIGKRRNIVVSENEWPRSRRPVSKRETKAAASIERFAAA